MDTLNKILTINLENVDKNSYEEIYLALIETNLNEIPKRSLRKALQISVNCLKYKGEQVISLQDHLEHKSELEADESGNEGLIEEIDRLKKLVKKLEADKNSLKIKLKEITEETIVLQNRIHQISTNESDKDSNDPLSELDKCDELLKKISTKNKHIKKLIRDVEALQIQNIEQSEIIIKLEKNIKILLDEKASMKNQNLLCENEKDQHKEHISELTSEISRLEGNITYLEEEREKADVELKDFIEKLEERARNWRSLIDQKDQQLESLKSKYELLKNENPKKTTDKEQEQAIDQFVEAISERDNLIVDLENKVKTMAEEMIISTKLMNQISAEREIEKQADSEKNRNCCKSVQDALNLLQQRYKELAEMMEKVEDDNITKSKQAASALKLLDEFKTDDDVLGKSLRKVTNFERKLSSRDKQIKALIMEINSLHELAQENSILRKKLNIPEDEIILTTNLVAKQRNKDKILERLTLKLRASEEMRLQLKLEKMDLKKELIELKRKESNEKNIAEKSGTRVNFQPERSDLYCDNCLKNIQSIPNQESIIKEIIKDWEDKYSEVIEENENLRVGMHEILEKIRDYDASSDHITIDCSILEKVLHALDARSISGWYHPAMRIQNELIAVKEREYALKEKILKNEKNHNPKMNMSDTLAPNKPPDDKSNPEPNERDKNQDFETSIDDKKIEHHDNQKELGEIHSLPTNQQEIIVNEEHDKNENKMELFTMLAERSFEQEIYKNELKKLTEKNRNLQIELEIMKTYKIQFHELANELKKSEKEIVSYCSDLVERSTETEIKLKNLNKSFEFLKEDFDKTLNDFKFSENINIALIADLKKEINNKKQEINLIKLNENRRKSNQISKDEITTLKLNYSKCQNQMANFITTFLKDKKNLELTSELMDPNFGIINENLILDFLTNEEYENIKNTNKILQQKIDDLLMKSDKLEELLLITQEQVKSQQKLISEITDNHIDLRHLVADLQSSSEEKFLIVKKHKDLEIFKKECIKLRFEKENLEKDIQNEKILNTQLLEKMEQNQKQLETQNLNNSLKVKFLKKFAFSLQEKYCKYTPLIYLTDFVTLYIKLLNKFKEENHEKENYLAKITEFIENKLKTIENFNQSEDVIKLVQLEVKCNYLEDQLQANKEKLKLVEEELNTTQMKAITDSEQLKTLQALFGHQDIVKKINDISVQTSEAERKSIAINTENVNEDNAENIASNVPIQSTSFKTDFQSQFPSTTIKTSLDRQDTVIIKPAPRKLLNFDKDKMTEEINSLKNQLQQAKTLASKRSALLLEAENKISETSGRLIEMEKIIEIQKKNTKSENYNIDKKHSGIIETTITSLQSLLSEKDTTLNHYQELLKTEREQHLKSCETYEKEIRTLHKIQNENENTIKIKIQELLDLKEQLKSSTNSLQENQKENEKNLSNGEFDPNCDNSLNEISDEKIEEMFLDESRILTPPITNPLYLDRLNNDEYSVKHMQHLQMQIRDLKSRELLWDNSIRLKEEEIQLLKEKLNLLQEREKNEGFGNVEIDQLKVLLEEKDKHINDLMETLTSFHDDQQKFLSETSLYSTDQMTQLGSNLNRCEATNKILQTQLDALKRQLTTLSQREKQSRDLANSLRNQLIKRPVVSIKSELNSRTKSEQQQKRIQYLETELDAAKKEIQKQQQIIEAKRAKNASEVSLWEKQKRHQQNAEKLKQKLEETEQSLEKTRSLLNAARTTINKLERDKNALQTASSKNTRINPSSNSGEHNVHMCCHNLSCPNNHTPKIGMHSENSQSECSTERVREHRKISNQFIEDLKSHIAAQQRRIHALETGLNGSNAMITEIEKLQERISFLEAQNIRWEAKNLQLQLDLDLMQQGDENERNKKRIKYLEDYILALKEELAQFEAHKEYNSRSNNDKQFGSPDDMVETILSLKRIIERLKSENKILKDGNSSHTNNDNQSPSMDQTKLKHLYAEAMNKISKLQIELQLKSNYREQNIRSDISSGGDGDFMRELNYVKDQLIKKTQLLEKAKILLTRAAAKEKSLKDQIALWKRKCSELQNVPVIEEISE